MQNNLPYLRCRRCNHGSFALLAAALLLAPIQTVAQQSADALCRSLPLAENEVYIDHSRGFVCQDGHRVDTDGTIYVPPKEPLLIWVANTNTALYKFSLDSKEVDAPEVEEFKAFLSAVGPYAISVLTASSPLPVLAGAQGSQAGVLMSFDALLSQDIRAAGEDLVEETPRLEQAMQEWKGAQQAVASRLKDVLKPSDLEASLKELDQLITSGDSAARRSSLKQVDLATIAALDEVRAQPAAVAATRERFQQAVGQTFACSSVEGRTRCQLTAVGDLARLLNRLTRQVYQYEQRLSTVHTDDDVVEALLRLAEAAAAVNKTLAPNAAKPILTPAPLAPYEQLLAQAKKALEDADKLLQAAYAIEEAAVALLTAEDEWRPTALLKVKVDKGRDVTLKIEKKSDPDLARAAVNEPASFSFKAMPGWFFRPAVGLSLVGARQATYPTYEAVEVDGAKLARATGAQDNRFTYTLDLAFTTRYTDWREANGRALWFPVFSINPTDDVRAVGLGAGFTFARIIKLGAGALWTRHQVLDGIAAGQEVTAERPFKTRPSYGFDEPKPYVSISIVGWPPFVN